MAMAETGSGRSVTSALVCHPEPLIAAAIAAAVEERHVASHTVCTSTLTGALSALRTGVDIAVVFDSCSEDVIDLFEAIRHRGAGTPVLVVTESTDPARAALLLESGASGIVPASCGTDELCEALESASRGNVVIDGAMRTEVLEALRSRRVQRRAAQEQLARLSPTDVGVLRYLCDGLTVSRIARRLSLSPYTVRGRIRVIGASLGVTGQLRIASVGRRLFAAAPPMPGVDRGVAR
jgi:two-component system capsular synthesis response regulator RcsB